MKKFSEAPASVSADEWEEARFAITDPSVVAEGLGSVAMNSATLAKLSRDGWKSLSTGDDRNHEYRRCQCFLELTYHLISRIQQDVKSGNDEYKAAILALEDIDTVTRDLDADQPGSLGDLEQRVRYLESNFQGPIQSYTPWRSCRNGEYYVSTYRYRAVGWSCYRCQCCIWFPSNPEYVYYYSERDCCYWGRYHVGASDGLAFSWVAAEDRVRGRFGDLPNNDAFGFPDTMPKIPESQFDRQWILPPPATPGAE